MLLTGCVTYVQTNAAERDIVQQCNLCQKTLIRRYITLCSLALVCTTLKECRHHMKAMKS